MKIIYADGHEMQWRVSDDLSVHPDGNVLKIYNGEDASVEFNIENVEALKYFTMEAGIDEIAPSPAPQVYVVGSLLYCEGTGVVNIISPAGINVYSGRCGADNPTTIDLSQFEPGIKIVSFDNTPIFKILIR